MINFIKKRKIIILLIALVSTLFVSLAFILYTNRANNDTDSLDLDLDLDLSEEKTSPSQSFGDFVKELESKELKNEMALLKNEITNLKNQKSSTPDIVNDNFVIKNSKKVALLICTNNSKTTVGSGVIIGTNKGIITNSHVVNGASLCLAGITDNYESVPERWYEMKAEGDFGYMGVDIAFLFPTDPLPDDIETVLNICPSNTIKIGDEIIVLGYPGIGGSTITATNGIISGSDGYYLKTSAKIEYGNSGGGAFLKNKDCWFGIPTAVSKGDLDSLGIIINYSSLHDTVAKYRQP